MGKPARLVLLLILLGCSSPTLDRDAGRVTFGQSVDMTTGILTGRATSFTVGHDVAYRAALSKITGPGTLRLSGSLDGTVVIDSTSPIETEGALYAGTLPGALLFQVGTFQFRVLDVGNNELAAGSFTVVE